MSTGVVKTFIECTVVEGQHAAQGVEALCDGYHTIIEASSRYSVQARLRLERYSFIRLDTLADLARWAAKTHISST